MRTREGQISGILTPLRRLVVVRWLEKEWRNGWIVHEFGLVVLLSATLYDRDTVVRVTHWLRTKFEAMSM